MKPVLVDTGPLVALIRKSDRDHARCAAYADLGPQLADASLMFLAETLQISDVFTLDRRDFSVYRLASGETLNIHPE